MASKLGFSAAYARFCAVPKAPKVLSVRIKNKSYPKKAKSIPYGAPSAYHTVPKEETTYRRKGAYRNNL
jgi:hypothetical protein